MVCCLSGYLDDDWPKPDSQRAYFGCIQTRLLKLFLQGKLHKYIPSLFRTFIVFLLPDLISSFLFHLSFFSLVLLLPPLLLISFLSFFFFSFFCFCFIFFFLLLLLSPSYSTPCSIFYFPLPSKRWRPIRSAVSILLGRYSRLYGPLRRRQLFGCFRDKIHIVS